MRISRSWAPLVLGLLLARQVVAGDIDASLCEAAEAGDGLQIAIKKGANPNAVCADGSPVIVRAAGLGGHENVITLLKWGADPSSRGAGGATALSAAIGNGQLDLVGLLLAAGADPSIPNTQGETAKSLATKLGYDDIARLLQLYSDKNVRLERPCEYLRLTADSVTGEQTLVLPVPLERAEQILEDSMMAYGFRLEKKRSPEKFVGLRVFPGLAVEYNRKHNWFGEQLISRLTEEAPGTTRIVSRTNAPPRDRKNRQWTTAVLGHAKCLCELLDGARAAAELPSDRPKQVVPIGDGTPVILRYRRHVFSERAEAGTRVEFQVAAAVVSNGVVVVRRGTIAEGEILEAEKSRSFNRAGTLNLAVRDVTAVDGQRITLRGPVGTWTGGRASEGEVARTAALSGLIGFSMLKGEEVLFRAGWEVAGFTAGDHQVAADLAIDPGASPEAP